MRGLEVGGVLAVLLVAACGQSGGGGGRDAQVEVDGGVPDAGFAVEDLPPVILTRQLLPARLGQPYVEKLSAHGTPPLSWSLPEKAAELGWLAVEPASGVLSGVPAGQGPGLVALTVRVRDGSDGGRTDSRLLVLRLVECEDGAVRDCFVPSSNACLQGTRGCSDGGWGGCEGGRGSTDLAACGASCGVCGPGALACADGRCACGAGQACAGATPTCCARDGGAACVNLLGDPEACGACGEACDAGTRLNVTRRCDGGVCDFPCASARYADCDGAPGTGCEADLQATATCGRCGNACPAPAGGTASCEGGACGQACPAGTHLCPTNTGGASATTCYPVNERSNCGGCGRPCPANLPNTTSTACVGGVCQLSCAPGYADCDGEVANGCEQGTRSDRGHCGGCNQRCAADGGTSGAFCVNGQCVFCEPCGSVSACCQPGVCDRGFSPPRCIQMFQ